MSRVEKATNVDIEVARVVGKAEAGKELTAKETLMLLPYAIIQDVENMMREYEETGKVKPRRRFRF